MNTNTLLNEASTMPVSDISDTKWDKAVERIEDIICDYQNITREQLRGVSRLPHITDGRHMAYFILKIFTNTTFANVGKRYNVKRLNVYVSIHKVEDLYDSDKYFHKKLDNILRLLTTDSKLMFGQYKNLLPTLNE